MMDPIVTLPRLSLRAVGCTLANIIYQISPFGATYCQQRGVKNTMVLGRGCVYKFHILLQNKTRVTFLCCWKSIMHCADTVKINFVRNGHMWELYCALQRINIHQYVKGTDNPDNFKSSIWGKKEKSCTLQELNPNCKFPYVMLYTYSCKWKWSNIFY